MDIISDIDSLPDNDSIRQGLSRQKLLGLKAGFAGAAKVIFLSVESLGENQSSLMTCVDCLTGQPEKCWVGSDRSLGLSMLDYITARYGSGTPFWIVKFKIELNERTSYIQVQEVRDDIPELEIKFQEMKRAMHGQTEG